MKRYSVFTDGTADSNRAGSVLNLEAARKLALSYMSQTRNVQIYLEWEIKLPFGWMLFRTKKLINWHTGETL